jgi:D-alanine transaminase
MTRLAYVNGRYVRHALASVHVEDRGFQFADGVYEVCAVRDHILIDEAPHLDRLERSLAALRIAMPVSRRALCVILRELAARNRLVNGLVYVQVTRGQARRDHGFPEPGVAPTLVVTARSLDLARYDRLAVNGVKVLLTPEIRWARCDIKSVSLLPNVLAKQQAREAGCFEAWFVTPDGTITEGASSNAWIVDSAGRLRTRPKGQQILPGITRDEILALCRDHGIVCDETPFTEQDVVTAREAFVTAATLGAMPVVQVGPHRIGDGTPGPVSRRIRALYWGTRGTDG